MKNKTKTKQKQYDYSTFTEIWVIFMMEHNRDSPIITPETHQHTCDGNTPGLTKLAGTEKEKNKIYKDVHIRVLKKEKLNKKKRKRKRERSM